MKPQTAKRANAALVVCGAALASAALAQAGGRSTVMFQDAVVSQDIRVVNGRPYVPLADMAKALGGFAVKTASGYQIKTKAADTEAAGVGDTGTPGMGEMAGLNGATAGLSGKLGDTVSDGRWAFQLADYKAQDTYTLQRDGGVDAAKLGGNADVNGGTIDAKPDYSVVTVICRVKNRQKQPQAFASGGGWDTVLIDDKGVSYAPIGWDQAGGMLATRPLPPGATAEVTAIFLVPFGTNLRDAVFTLANVADRTPHDVHFALGPTG